MKKVVMFSLGVTLLALISCMKEETIMSPIAPTGEEVEVTISSQVSNPSPLTRLGEITPPGYSLRYIMEVTDVSTGAFYTRLDQKGSVFKLRLAVGHEYSYTIWADYAPTADLEFTPVQDLSGSSTHLPRIVEKYYDTSNGLDRIVMTSSTYPGNNPTRDAFYAKARSTGLINSSFSVSAILRRPFGQIRVKANDLDYLPGGTMPDGVLISYLGPAMYGGFDATIGEVDQGSIIFFSFEEIAPIAAAINIPYGDQNETANDGWISYDYVFADKLNSWGNSFEISLYNGTTLLSRKNIENIPARQNYRTIISGNLVTALATIDVDIHPFYDTEEYQVAGLYELDSILKIPLGPDVTKKIIKVNDPVDFTLGQTINIPEGVYTSELELLRISLGSPYAIPSGQLTITSDELPTVIYNRVIDIVIPLELSLTIFNSTDLVIQVNGEVLDPGVSLSIGQ